MHYLSFSKERHGALAAALCTALLLPAGTLSSSAQTHPAHRNDNLHSTALLGGDTIGASEALRKNTPQSYQLSNLPRFAIFGKEGKFYLGIGGQVKVTAGYDFGDVIDNPNNFTTSAIPMHPAKGNGAKFQLSAQQSNLFLNFVALPGSDNQIGAYVSMNFTGNNYNPTLAQAYLKYRGITAGYAYTLFGDMAAIPPCIDYEGPNALTAFPHGVIQYEKDFGRKKDWKVGIALEQTNASFTTTGVTTYVSQRVPDIPAYVQYSWAGGNGWLRFSALLRNMYYRNTITGKNVDKVGWGIKLSGSTPVVGGLTAYYQAVYGKGVASYIQDLIGCGLDLTPSKNDPGVLKSVKAWGAYGGLQYNFTKDVYASATYSHVRTYADRYAGGSTPYGEQYRWAQYLVTNVFWNVNDIISTGIEYLYGRRMNYDGNQRHDNRLQAALILNF